MHVWKEMRGLAYFISDQPKKDSECMENAFSTYMKLGKSGFQNATRCGLWWAEMLKARDQHKEAASVYFRICGEEPLHAAVMLEQASYCFMLTKPAMLHKYGFHLVLSGDHYKNCNQVHVTLLEELKLCTCVAFFRTHIVCLFSRLTMQFVHTKVQSLFINQLHGAISKIIYIFILDSGMQLLGCMMLQLETCSKYWTVATNPRQPKRFFSGTFSTLLRCLAYTCGFTRSTEAAKKNI
jgi:hypothetical protein